MDINDKIPFYWKAEYEGGTVFQEYEPNTLKEFSFKDIKKDKIKKFSLIGKTSEIYFNSSDGIFRIINKKKNNNIATIELIDKESNPFKVINDFKDIIQYKGFYVDGITPGETGSFHTNTISYHIGWKNKIRVEDSIVSIKVVFTILLNKYVKLEFKISSDSDIELEFGIRFSSSNTSDNTLYKKISLKKYSSETFELKL